MLDDHTIKPDAPVLCLGGAGVDIVGHLRAELRPGSSAPAYVRTSFGGVARNVAENLARLGQPVNLITAVGMDENGERLLRRTQEAGVDVSSVLLTDQHPTGTYVGVVNSVGALQFAIDDMRAITALTPQIIRQHEALFKQASLLFIDANLPKDTLRTTMSLARQAHLPVCADPTATGLAERFRRYLPRFTLITPNSAEVAVFCESDFGTISNRRQAIAAAKHLVSLGVAIVIITLGERGLCYATSETSGYIPAIRTEIVDPTGAGDALSAALIFSLLNEIPLDDAVRLGVSAASLTLRYPGAVVPDLSLEKLYNELVI